MNVIGLLQSSEFRSEPLVVNVGSGAAIAEELATMVGLYDDTEDNPLQSLDFVSVELSLG